MAAKIFLTGATGYIGGETLHQIAQLPEKHEIRCLVRGDDKAALISEKYPQVNVVKGDLDDSSLVESEARKADVVFHLASTRHEVSSKAIAAGLGHQDREGPGYWIQISGASMFSGREIKENKYGEASDKVYDDVADIEEVLSTIKSSPARVVDNLVLSQDASKVKTALIPGPLFYGKGKGPGNTRSIQAPELGKYNLQNGHGMMVGKGKSAWSNVHVGDLGKMFVLLLQAAVQKRDGLWNLDGIFFPENGTMTFGEIAEGLAKSAHDQGYTKSSEVKSVTVEEANNVMPHGAVLLGTNAKLKSARARKELGWKPTELSLADALPIIVKQEADLLHK